MKLADLICTDRDRHRNASRITMFEFTETIQVEAPPEDVWTVLKDIETWWPASNPEHISLERLDDKGVEVGARLRIREKIAGIPGEAIGEITRVDAVRAVTWEAPQARYKWHGVPLTIGEGVTWRATSSPALTARAPNSALTCGRHFPNRGLGELSSGSSLR